jgi:hypothetical protein
MGGVPSSSMQISPVVVYESPGSFDVVLGGGGTAGTASASGTVEVTTGELGAQCGADGDCISGLSCLCAGGTCPGALAAGVCSKPCVGGACDAGGRCVDFSRGKSTTDPPDGGYAGFSSPICLPACTADADCRTGFRCRELPVLVAGAAAMGPYAWQHACYPPGGGDVGASCAAVDGDFDDAACLSGRCLQYGARGLCTSNCMTTTCPSTASCSAFAETPTDLLCLLRCDATHPCTDPLLACQTAGGTGGLGFPAPASDPAGTTYCSPRRCTMPSDCAPSGTCQVHGAASFCIPN